MVRRSPWGSGGAGHSVSCIEHLVILVQKGWIWASFSCSLGRGDHRPVLGQDRVSLGLLSSHKPRLADLGYHILSSLPVRSHGYSLSLGED